MIKSPDQEIVESPEDTVAKGCDENIKHKLEDIDDKTNDGIDKKNNPWQNAPFFYFGCNHTLIIWHPYTYGMKLIGCNTAFIQILLS